LKYFEQKPIENVMLFEARRGLSWVLQSTTSGLGTPDVKTTFEFVAVGRRDK